MTVSPQRHLDQLTLVASRHTAEGDYWLDRFSGDFMKHGFPFDPEHRCKAGKDSAGEPLHLELPFPGGLGEGVLALSKGTDVRLNMVLASALFALLSRYTGSRDICAGMPIYRQEGQQEFINPVLALRLQPRQDMSFKQLILDTRQTILDAVEHQNYPLEVLAHRLEMGTGDGGVGQSPFFDVAFMLDSIHHSSYFNHLRLPLLFIFIRRENNLLLKLEYDNRRYLEATVSRIAGHFFALLEGAMAQMDAPLANIGIITGDERQHILDTFSRGEHRDIRDITLHGWFEEQVKKTPENLALSGVVPVDENNQSAARVDWTYGELNKRADTLAAVLREKGVGPDSIVAVKMNRQAGMITALLGILKAGGAYMPLDPNYPAGRTRFILEDSGARWLVAENDDTGLEEWEGEKIFPLHLTAESLEELPALEMETSSLAYVIYTSGTTGKPKGVLAEHRNVVAYLHAFFREFEIKETDVVLQLASYCFDVFTEEVYPLLLRGGGVVMPDDREAVDFSSIMKLIRDYGVTIIDTTPMLLQEFNKLTSGNLGTIRTVISGGDVLKRDYVSNLVGSTLVYNTYGPTETTVCASFYRCHEEMPTGVPIGKPIANTDLYIVAPSNPDQLQPVGIAGELCISGPGVARGYLNRPELTAEKFINSNSQPPDQFSRLQSSNAVESPLERGIMGSGSLPARSGGVCRNGRQSPRCIYKSGDLVRWMEDGNIAFLGRIDSQVKIRGFRIETGEIENRLLALESVAEAVVTLRKDNKDGENRDGQPLLCAYVVPVKQGDFSSSECRAQLSGNLPEYMIPAVFMPLQKIPLTSHGKVDLAALPEPEIRSDAPYVAPRDDTEKGLARIWRGVFGIDRIGIDDDFFDLGGHSLTGIQVANEIHREFDTAVQFTEIFNHRTIRRLAAHIAGQSKGKRYMSIEPVEKREYYPLSSAQKRLFVVQQMDRNSVAYNMAQGHPLDDVEPDIEFVNRNLRLLMDRHESLRTSFISIDGRPVQRVQETAGLSLEVKKLPPINEELEPLEVRERVRGLFVRPFDLSAAPLLRVGLIRVAGAGNVLLIDTHHIISDALSNDILYGDFMAISSGLDLEPLRLQYRDFSHWQNHRRQEGKIDAQEEYWLAQFREPVPEMRLLTDYDRPEIPSFQGGRVRFSFPPEHSKLLAQMVLLEKTTTFTIFLALINVLMFKLYGPSDIVIGAPVTGRGHPDLDRTLGMFVNTLPLRNYPKGNISFPEFLGDVHQRTMDAFENQDYLFEDLVEKVAVRREVNRNPLFDILFSFHESGAGAEEKTEAADSFMFGHESASVKFDLTFDLVRKGDGFYPGIRYATELFKPETIENIIQYFKNLVKMVVEDSKIQLADIQLESAAGAEMETRTSASLDDLEDE